MQKVKIGFVGVGNMGQCAHLKQYATLPEFCDVVAIAEMNGELAAAVARRYGVPKVYANHQDLLKNEKLDGIIAAQQFTRHGSLLPELLQAGLPLFTEKPIAGSVQVGEKIAAAAAKNGSFYMVGYHKRSDPATIWAKAEIDRLKASGEIGKLKYVRITMPAGDWIASGFWDLIQSTRGGGAIQADPPAPDLTAAQSAEYIAFVNYYIHQVNLMRHLLGEPYKVTHVDPSNVLLVGASQSGVCCSIEMTPFQTSIDWQEVALVCFERGWVKIELPAPLAINRPGKVTVFKDAGNGATPGTYEPQLPWISAMRQQAITFCRAIRGEAKPPCEAAEALEDLRVARQHLKCLRNV